MKKGIVALVVLAIIGLVGFIFGKPYYDLHFGTTGLNVEKTIYIPTGSSLSDIGDLLDADVMAKSDFLSYAEKLEFTEEKVEAGKYTFQPNSKAKEVIYALKNGNQEVKDVRITFNNCKTIMDMAGKVAPNIEADSAEIVDYIMKPETISKYGFKEETIIALFLPDTYEVGEWDMTAEEFVQFMADQFKAFWNNEGAGRGSKLANLNLSQSEVATLASIIESEQGAFPQEWETIAGLYLNRIRNGWLLQSDPTAKFCWGDELADTQRLLFVHMQRDCPYNTYIHPGLPPGPIKMVSKKAIDAVLNAEKHNYFYMCARPDNSGLHNFANSLSEHNRNAAAFSRYMDSLGL
ncbi:MAG: endolytic transglycosylase MltG [Crocinitomicaceae bacterium]